MGAAAYNRGSAKLSREFDNVRRSVEFKMMDDLNAMPKAVNALTPFGPIRFSFSNGGCWAVCPVTGFGYFHVNLREAVRSYNVAVVECDNGEFIAQPIVVITQ